MKRGKYSQVSGSEQEANKKEAPRRREINETGRYLARRCDVLLHTLVWCAAAAFVIYYGDMYRVITTDSRIDHIFLNIFVLCVVIISGALFYMVIWLTWSLPIPVEDYSVYCPRVVHVSAGA
eukprot:CAMPEP_0175092206 /NCGR_PEP_ID=MMETSP0086_2-20121207/2339_1 /TAXON_ID=136419 /ORGANISM="Unknown Unknown, Strain D1" /LENGTH=121 /DNA_ID=CAMNT_0016365053 /DNA_START=36 /DNA_END=398 /DNA_ORIENTATION=-